jgi:di/tricarboxylate transporter
VRLHREPSQLLMPLAFAAHTGSLLVLTGSPVNVVISEAAADAGAGRIGFLEFALVGVPLLAGTIAIVVVFGERLLPHRTPRSMPMDFSAHARTLVHQYGLDDADALLTRSKGAAEVVIPPRSGLVGETAFPGMVTETGDLVVLAVQRKGEELAGESRWRSATRSCFRGRGGRSKSISPTPTCFRSIGRTDDGDPGRGDDPPLHRDDRKRRR